jgi:hypothetical protein
MTGLGVKHVITLTAALAFPKPAPVLSSTAPVAQNAGIRREDWNICSKEQDKAPYQTRKSHESRSKHSAVRGAVRVGEDTFDALHPVEAR